METPPASRPDLFRVGVLTGVVAAVLTLATIAHPVPAEAAECSGPLQAKIDAAPAGATVTANPCIYREQVKITRPLTLVGQPGSEIRGSEVWGGWSRLPDGTFRSSDVVPTFVQEDVSCDRGTQRCAWPEQVFVDGKPLQQVSESTPLHLGKFKIGTSNKVNIATDPRGKTVEVTTRKHWIVADPTADNVTVKGFTMRHAANDWRCGALQSHQPSSGSGTTFSSCRTRGDADGWQVKNNRLLHTAGAVMSVRSRNALIEGNEVAYGGQLGIHNPQDGSVVRANNVHHNNTEAFCMEFGKCVGYSTDGNSVATNTLVEAGGIKVAGGIGNVTVTNNEFAHNLGQGVWFDVDTHDITVSNNRIHHNARKGIFFEISDRTKIFSNSLWENGWATPMTMDGAGIEIGNSDDAEVFDNVLAWNADGISIRCIDRNDDDSICQRTNVHDNYVMQETTNIANDSADGLALGWIGGGGSGSLYAATNANRGTSNAYHYGYAENGRERFAWNSRLGSLSSFNATPGEVGGHYLTSSQKNTVLSNKGMPANPEPR